MNSRVHPKYMTKYRVSNWPEYERGLVRRGDITLWLSPEAIGAWSPAPGGRRGGQQRYSDLAIETALILRRTKRPRGQSDEDLDHAVANAQSRG